MKTDSTLPSLGRDQLTAVVGGARSAPPSEVADALAANRDDARACMQGAFKAGFDVAKARPNATLDLDAVFPANPMQITGPIAAGAAAGSCLDRIQQQSAAFPE